MKNIILSLCTLLIGFNSLAQTVVSSDATAQKYSNSGMVNLGNDAFVTWYQGYGTSTKQQTSAVQLIRGGEQAWMLELDFDDNFYFDGICTGSPGGKYTYLILQNRKEEGLIVQVDNAGDLVESVVEVPSHFNNIKAAVCDENNLYLICDTYDKTPSVKESFSKFDPKLITYSHEDGLQETSSIELEYVEYNNSNSQWQFRDFDDGLFYFSKTEVYKDQIKWTLAAVNTDGTKESSITKAINIENLQIRGLSIEGSKANNIKCMYIKPNETVTSSGILRPGSFEHIEVDAENNRIFVMWQEGKKSKPTLAIHSYDLSGEPIKRIGDIKIKLNAAGGTSAFNIVQVDLKHDGGIIVDSKLGEALIIESEGSTKTIELDAEKIAKIVMPLQIELYESNCKAFVLGKGSKLIKWPLSRALFEPHIIITEDYEYLFFMNESSKSAEVLQFKRS